MIPLTVSWHSLSLFAQTLQTDSKQLQPLLHLKAVATSKHQKVADIGLAAFGMAGCIYTTALTISNWAAGNADAKPGYCDA